MLLTLLPHSGDQNWFLNGRKELPNQSFLFYFLHAATVGGRGVCVVQTCTGCVVSLQNRTRRHNAPHAAEQMAAPIFVSDLCRSSAVSPPSTDGIGVRVLPASRVLAPKRDACAFLAQQEKPETQPESPVTVSYTA